MGTSVPAILARVRSPQKEESRERSVPFAVRVPCPSPSFPAILSSSNVFGAREFSPNEVCVNLNNNFRDKPLNCALLGLCVFALATRNNNRKNQRARRPKALVEACILTRKEEQRPSPSQSKEYLPVHKAPGQNAKVLHNYALVA